MFSCFYDVISLCFLIFVSLHLMSYCNFVSAREGRCKCTFSALPSCSYLFAFVVVAKYCYFNEINRDGDVDCNDDRQCLASMFSGAASVYYSKYSLNIL